MPKTLVEAIRYFSDPKKCMEFMIPLRWPDGVVTCFHCGSKEQHSFIATKNAWMCKSCRKRFSIKMGTILEDSKLGLDKWLVAIWLLTNAKNGISSWELHRSIGVTQKTAWFMLQRIRMAFHVGSFDKKLAGIVEVDETYIGGKARNMHKDKREERIKGRGPTGKVVVMGLLERKGEVRTKVVRDIKRKTLQDHIQEHVERGSEVHTDSLASYEGLDPDYVHNVINHAEAYVNGHIYTNGLENYWSLLKRAITGTYTSCEPFHLFRYLDEQSFRFNNRQGTDEDRFLLATKSVSGKRLKYKTLIGEDGPSTDIPKPNRGRKKNSQ